MVEEVTEDVLKFGSVVTGGEEEAETIKVEVEFTTEFTGAVEVGITIVTGAVASGDGEAVFAKAAVVTLAA